MTGVFVSRALQWGRNEKLERPLANCIRCFASKLHSTTRRTISPRLVNNATWKRTYFKKSRVNKPAPWCRGFWRYPASISGTYTCKWSQFRRQENRGPHCLSYINEEPPWKLAQKVALTHNSVKNNECDVTYVLKEPRRRSKCVIHCCCHWVVYQRRVSD
jgi:hypothetical protein